MSYYLNRKEQAISIPGHVGGYVYRLDNVPNGYVLAIAFESKAAYLANAQSPEQDARYREMLTFLDGEPTGMTAKLLRRFTVQAIAHWLTTHIGPPAVGSAELDAADDYGPRACFVEAVEAAGRAARSARPRSCRPMF